MTESSVPPLPAFRQTLRSRLEEIESASDALGAWLEAAGVPPRVQANIALMLDELVTNIITHGYAGQPTGEIHLEATHTPGAVQVTLTDHAVAFDPLQVAEPDTSLDIEEREIGGLGVFFVRRMADEIGYRRLNDGQADAANELRFTKRYVPDAGH